MSNIIDIIFVTGITLWMILWDDDEKPPKKKE